MSCRAPRPAPSPEQYSDPGYWSGASWSWMAGGAFAKHCPGAGTPRSLRAILLWRLRVQLEYAAGVDAGSVALLVAGDRQASGSRDGSSVERFAMKRGVSGGLGWLVRCWHT